MGRKGGPSRGCAFCRQRKIKCDETSPECLQCKHFNRKCPGPIQGIMVQDMSSKLCRTKHGVGSIAHPVNASPFSSTLEEKTPVNDTALQKQGHGPRPCCQLPENRQLRALKVAEKPLTLNDNGPSIFLNTYSKALAISENPEHQLPTNAKDDLGLHKTDASITPNQVCIHADISGGNEPVPLTNDLRLSHQLRVNRFYCPTCRNLFVSTRVANKTNPRSIADSGVFDPFSCLPLRLDQNDQKWLYDWLSLSKKDAASWVAVPMGNDETFDPISGYWLPLILSDNTTFHGMMACNAFHTSGILTRDGLATQDAVMAGLAYKMKACHSINQRLASTDDYLSDTLIAAVHLLLSAEWLSSEHERYQTHLSGLLQMVKLRGGFFKLSPPVAFPIRHLETMIAMKFLPQVAYPCWSESKNADLHNNISQIFATQRLKSTTSSSHLLRSEITKLFPEDLMNNIRDIIDLVDRLESMSKNPTDFGQYYRASADSMALQRRLLAFDYSTLVFLPPLQTPHLLIPSLCRITTLIFFGNVVMTSFYTQGLALAYTGWRHYFPPVQPEDAQLPGHVHIVHDIFQNMDFDTYVEDYGDILLWVLMFASFSAQDAVYARQFFISKIREIVERKSLKDFEDVEKVLDSCLYHREVFDSPFRKLWHEIVEDGL